MTSAQITHRFNFFLGFVNLYSLQHNIQEWIRQEIVDDDPYEQETFSHVPNKPDTRSLEKIGDSDFRLNQ